MSMKQGNEVMHMTMKFSGRYRGACEAAQK